MNSTKTWDVIVIGAGPGGSTTASYLARTGARVLLLDKAEFPRDKPCGGGLSPNAIKIVADMGLLYELERIGFRINGICLVAPDGSELIAPIPSHPGMADYFFTTRRYLFDDMLLRHAIAAGAQFEPGVRIKNTQVARDRIIISGKRKHKPVQFSAQVVVIAVGASIPLLQQAGLMSIPPQFGLAARAYYTGLSGLSDRIEIRFDGAPLPGYAWIFPLSANSANVGAGFARPSPNLPPTPQAVLKEFLKHEPIRAIMAQSQREGPVRGFPLRMDFATARTFGERMVVVGEAAGLVNSFTGEGICYAMESGQIAAQVLSGQLISGDFSASALRPYDRRLRDRFQHWFVWTMRMRRVYMNDWLLNPLARAARRERAIERELLEALLGYRSPFQLLTPRMLYHVLRNWRAEAD